MEKFEKREIEERREKRERKKKEQESAEAISGLKNGGEYKTRTTLKIKWAVLHFYPFFMAKKNPMVCVASLA